MALLNHGQVIFSASIEIVELVVHGNTIVPPTLLCQLDFSIGA